MDVLVETLEKHIITSTKTEHGIKLTPEGVYTRHNRQVPGCTIPSILSVLQDRCSIVPLFDVLYTPDTSVIVGIDTSTHDIEVYLDSTHVDGCIYSMDVRGSSVNKYIIEPNPSDAYRLLTILPTSISSCITKITPQEQNFCVLSKMKRDDVFNVYFRNAALTRISAVSDRLMELTRETFPEHEPTVQAFTDTYGDWYLNWLGIALTGAGDVHIKVYAIDSLE